MKTVGEFKKAGLKFVNGDKGDVFCVKAHKYFAMSSLFDNKRATSFAWRENTGVKPEFNGFIDFTHKDGTEYFSQKVGSIHCYEWGIVGSANQIAKWRPSLNQPSVAESDTKQSAIHKAWVDLKGDLSNAEKHDSGGKFLVVCIKDGIAIKKGEYQIASHTTNNTEYWENVCTIPEFTSYCEKIAAEEKRMDIICPNGNDGLHYDNTAQQVEALALKRPSERMKVTLKEADDIGKGFVTRCVMMPTNPEFIDNETANAKVKSHIESLRPIFTQAMADAGELPPVGSLFIDIEYNENKQVLALAHHLVKVVYATDYDDVSQVDYFHADQDECKPIDTRTDKQKDIDAAFLSVNVDKPTLEVIYDLWRVGEKC